MHLALIFFRENAVNLEVWRFGQVFVKHDSFLTSYIVNGIKKTLVTCCVSQIALRQFFLR